MSLKKSLEIISRVDRSEPLRHGIPLSFWVMLSELLAQHPTVEAAVLYGSRSRDTHRNGSDVDVCLFGRDLSWDTRVRIANEFEDLSWPWRLDLTHWETTSSPRFRSEVRLDAELLYDRSGGVELPVALGLV